METISLTPAEALEKLKQGNRRFFSMRPKINAEKLLDQRAKAEKQQKPIAVVIACSDARIPPEYIFDQGIGDLYVIRVLGNVISTAQIGALEYAISELQTPLIVVMGYSACSATQLTLHALRSGKGPMSPFLKYIMNKIAPALKKEAQSVAPNNDDIFNLMTLETAVEVNTRNSLEQISQRSLIVRNALEANILRLVGAYYDLESGLVGFGDDN